MRIATFLTAAVSAAFFAVVVPAASAAARARAPRGRPQAAAAVPAASWPRVVVIHDDSGDDAKFSRSRAVNVQRLLDEAGLPSSLHPSSALAAALAAPTAVAHFVWASALPADAPRQLSSFVARGGRLVVHGSTSPALAAALGLEKPEVSYEEPAPGGVAWTCWAFSGTPPFDSPKRIDNRAAKVLRTCSAAATTTPVARWSDQRGRVGPVALWKCAAGWWIVRPLYDDGPSAPRSQLLCSLTCLAAPPLWKLSALRLRRRSWTGVVGDAPMTARDLEDARSAILKSAPRLGSARSRVKAVLEEAAAADAAATALFARGLYGAARGDLRSLAGLCSRARSAAMRVHKPSGAVFAVWEPTGFGGVPGGWAEAAKILAEAEVTDVNVWCGSLAGAVADIPGVPVAGTRAGRPDPLGEAIAQCHARGVKVHAWFAVLSFEGASPERLAAFAKEGRLLHSRNGAPIAWLDPASQANAVALSRALRALAARGVDGVNLDFVRYPGGAASRESPNAARIEALVSRLSRDLRAAAPKIRLSACVYGFYPGCVSGCGQDWFRWLDAGHVDFAVPMNYCADIAELEGLLERQKGRIRRVVCGIGAGANESRLDAPSLLSQVKLAFEKGCAGVSVYPFNARFAEVFAPALREALR